jgi:heat shock protein HslJ
MRFRTILPPLLAMTLLGACVDAAAVGTSKPDATAPTPPPSVAGGGMLTGAFVSTEVVGHKLAAGSKVTLSFKDGQLSANAGCNTMSGTVAVLGGKLSVGQLATTEMACQADLMAQDQWLAAFLAGATADFGAGFLNLTNGGVTIKLVDKATTNLPLVGTTWTLNGTTSGETASSVPQGVTATLMFQDGMVTVDTGCNSGSGTAKIDGDKITFGAITLTKKACMGDATGVEKQVVAVLSGTKPFKIDGSSLTIGGGQGGGLMYLGSNAPADMNGPSAAAPS